LKRTCYKSILLILCLSMFSSALSLGFVRASVPPTNSCYLTETIPVFYQEISNWDNPAIKTITIPDWDYPIKSVEMYLQAYCDIKGRYLRAIHFDVDGLGGGFHTWRLSGSQVRGDPSGIPPSGTISHGQTKTYTVDMSHVYFANPPAGPYGSYQHPENGRFYANFIPQFSPGEHTITSFVSTQDAFGGVDSWVTVILTFTFKYIPDVPIDFDPDTLNRKSEGKYVTVYIELPVGCDVDAYDIDPATVQLNGIPALGYPTPVIGDHDGNTFPDLMVKFDRQELVSKLMPGDSVLLMLSGECYDGTLFDGTDEIRALF